MSSQAPPSPDNPILSYYREWSEKTPYITRSVMIILVVSFLVSFIIPTDTVLGNSAFFTILNFELYRLLLSPLVGNSIFNIVLVGLFFPGMGGRMESSLGSSAFLFLLGTLTLVTNLAFVAVCLLLYYAANLAEAIFYDCSGFWSVLFGLITMECLQNPEQPRRMMMVPVDIPSKFFPLIMYVLFSLFSGPKLDFAIAMGVGFLYQKGYLDRIKLSSYYLESLESPVGMLHSLSRSRGWVLAGAALGHDAWIAVNSTAAGGQQGPNPNASLGNSAPAGRGGFGNWAAQETGSAGPDAAADNASKTVAPFAGSGRALGGAVTASSGGWLAARPVAGSGSTVQGKDRDRETVAARRLAALSHQQGASLNSSGGAIPGTGDTAEDDLRRLQVSESRRLSMAAAADERLSSLARLNPVVSTSSSSVRASTPTSETSLLAAAVSKSYT